jgi:hypothetical protein
VLNIRGAISSLHFCPTAQNIIMACFKSRNIGIWDIQRARCIAMKAGANNPEAVGWLPSGAAVCVSFMDGSLRIMARF